jgi:hypothetical protein
MRTATFAEEVSSFGFDFDFGGKGGDLYGSDLQRLQAGADQMRLEARQIALQVDDVFDLSVGVDLVEGFEDAI